ncbi:hypothetical protein GCM10023081_46950 [Arthrobacter ginkgonis]|uniref:Uncharacterized protein n=1 Tax=Arthrobacter ginkgonis TaxID=1630594 RepID=A0ABP7DKS6_9MICC
MSILTNPAYLEAAALVRQKVDFYVDHFGPTEDNLPAIQVPIAQELGYSISYWGLLDVVTLIGDRRKAESDALPLDFPVKDPDYPECKHRWLERQDDLISEATFHLIGHNYLMHKAAA